MISPIKTVDFDAIRLRLASPEQIHNWSHGEVTKPETINYRTQKPEKDGLFCEKIFGPSKDWECYCGKYRKIRYKGIVCDKCGVEVTRSIVRRERMGHIDLSAPVSHIWFLRGVPSKIGLILDLSVQNLEKVIYFANFIITEVEEELKEKTLEQIKQEFKQKKKSIESDFIKQVAEIKNEANQKKQANNLAIKPEELDALTDKKLIELNNFKESKLKELTEALNLAQEELEELKPFKIISENTYQDLSLKYGHIFEAGLGAGAIRKLLEKINLDTLAKQLENDVLDYSGSRCERAIKRSKLVKSLRANNIRPEWMILTAVPVIPPDLRPMVPLDGGRFATSDLNDLYRRVINRNNRLKQLVELNAPEVITRNEKRMLQEAVDALIDNSARHGKTVVASTGQKRMLKSIADILKGKQGRFRQNLLGKRADYSGRSVIVAGPYLKIYQCGLPKKMALELFKPFVISRLIKKEYVHNVRSATRFIELGQSEVWDILEDIIKGAYVFLNRAPTLHRLGIQAFQPILIEGKAIQIHPMVCAAFNADFDGDQMAVHVPLTEEAKAEARDIMLSKHNLLKPATGEPVMNPTQDIVWGSYYMTTLNEEEKEDESKMKIFNSPQEAEIAYELDQINLRSKIKVRLNGKIEITSVGKILFHETLPPKISSLDQAMDKKNLAQTISLCLETYGPERTAQLLDDIKEMSFKYLTTSGLSWGMDDVPLLNNKREIIQKADEKMDKTQNQYESGLLTQDERRGKIIEIWNDTKDEISEVSQKLLSRDSENSVLSMINSGARGAWGQLIQIIGMKGLVTNPAGEIIELPVKGSFKEGFDVLEYFISTHGTRKGLADTALRTANAGYLTRRLVDVAQDVVVMEEDCQDDEGMVLTQKESKEMGVDLVKRIMGRVVLEKIIDPKNKKIIIKKNELITEDKMAKLKKVSLEKIKIRSILTCKAKKGICQKCYGYDLSYNKLVKLGTATGIIAAQSIGEPGTQLTMRTFHTGGVAGLDITQGLPRVEELFEARIPKKKAFMSEVTGIARIETFSEKVDQEKVKPAQTLIRGQKIIKIKHQSLSEEKYEIKKKNDLEVTIKIKDGDQIKKGEVLMVDNLGKEIKAKNAGQVKIVNSHKVNLIFEKEKEEEYIIPPGYTTWVNDGDLVNQGDQLTEGGLDLHQLYKLKGREATQKYLIKEIQQIYASQGQKLNDKHIEIIARQLFSKVYVSKSGDSNLLPGEIIDKSELEEVNEEILNKKGEPIKTKELLLGISKVSLATRSFLSAASFQETARVLINAAITGKIDHLEGLKENVIIGRLIPAGTGFIKKV